MTSASTHPMQPTQPASQSLIEQPGLPRRHFLRFMGASALGVCAAGLGGCSSALPTEAIAAWRGPASDGGDVRLWLLGHAILAPHSHNLQSWVVDLRQPEEITLYCDRTRLLPDTDPLSRQIMMSQGTFVELLDLGARQKGLRADIELLPQGDFGAGAPDRRPTARIKLVADATVRPDPLFAQILARRTNREAYLPEVPSAAQLQAITAGVAPYPVRSAVGGDSARTVDAAAVTGVAGVSRAGPALRADPRVAAGTGAALYRADVDAAGVRSGSRSGAAARGSGAHSSGLSRKNSDLFPA